MNLIVTLSIFGLAGGLLSFIQGIYTQRIKSGKFLRKLVVEGLMGALLAILLYCFLQSCIIAVGFWVVPRPALYGLSFLAGFSTSRVLQKLREQFTVLFETELDKRREEERNER